MIKVCGFAISLSLLSPVLASGMVKECTDTVGYTLNELSVTALKTDGKMRETAESGTLLTAPQLERMGAKSVKGASAGVPNFLVPDYGSRITSSIYVRGVGSRMDQPAVGLYVDNIPVLNKDAYDFDFPDLDRVEVLRGPQGTLYGRNTMGGIINVSTASPFSGPRRRVSFEMTTRGNARMSFISSGRWSEKAALSTSVFYNGIAGEYDNAYNNRRVGQENAYGVKLKLALRPKPGLDIQNAAFFNNSQNSGYAYENVATGRIDYNDTCYYKRLLFMDGLTVRKRFESMTFSSMTSVQHINDDMTLDQDFLPEDYFTLTQKKREWAFTEELLLKGDKRDDGYNWLAGLFAFYKSTRMDAPVTFKDAGIRELIEKHRNDANPLRPITWNTRSFPLQSDFEMPTGGLAAYHEGNMTFGRFTLTCGLRLDWEHPLLDYHSECHTSYTIYDKPDDPMSIHRRVRIDIDEKGKLKRDYLAVLPKLAVCYELAEAGNLYAKISRGYKAGGYNTQMFSEVLQQRIMWIMGIGSQYNVDDIVSYKPEYSWNYEAGTHLDIFQGRLGIDASVFVTDCRDQQVTVFPAGTTTGRMTANAAKTLSKGLELSAKASLPGGLSLSGSYGLTDARFRAYDDGINDFKGKKIPYVPLNTLYFNGVWERVFNKAKERKIELDATLRGTGRIYWNSENTLSQPLYWILDAGVALVNKNFSLRIWGRNLTDTKYKTFYFMSMGNEFVQRGRKPEFGITIAMNLTRSLLPPIR